MKLLNVIAYVCSEVSSGQLEELTHPYKTLSQSDTKTCHSLINYRILQQLVTYTKLLFLNP